MFIAQSLRNALDKLFFAGFLLLGIQLPNFLIQYQQNLDAHYHESASQLQKYQRIADLFYAGNLQALLIAHEDNPLAAIKAEAAIISDLMQRKTYLQEELSALQNKSLLVQSAHLLKHLDFDITDEVLDNYSLNVPLNSEAIIIGMVLAFVASMLVHILLASVLFLFRSKSPSKVFSS